MDEQAQFRFKRKMNYDFARSGRERADLWSSLQRMEREELVRQLPEEELAFLFKHALTQDAAYSTLIKQERKQLHLRVAETLEKLNPDDLDQIASLLAQHYAEAGALTKAAAYSIRSGDAGMRVFAAIEARASYSRAIELLQQLPETPANLRALFETMVKYANLALGSEPPAAFLKRLLNAEELGKRLLVENIRADRVSLTRLRYEIARFLFTVNEPFQAFVYCDLMMEDARILNDRGLHDLAVGLRGVGELDQGHFVQAAPGLEAAANYLERIENWRDWAWFRMNYAFALAAQGDIRAARDIGAQVSRRADETQDYWMRCVCALYHSLIYWVGGALEQSLASAQRLIQLAEEGHEFTFLQLATLPKMWVESRMGNYAAAAQTLAQRQALIDQMGMEIVWLDWGAAARAELAFNAGDAVGALTLAAQAVPVAQSVGSIFAEGLVHRTWAQALAQTSPSDATAVEAHFEASVVLLVQNEARLEAARSQLAWGKYLLERGNATGAREHLEKAAAQFQASGLEPEFIATRALLPS